MRNAEGGVSLKGERPVREAKHDPQLKVLVEGMGRKSEIARNMRKIDRIRCLGS